MVKKIHIVFIIIIELIFISIIIFLGVSILNLRNERTKGAQYITKVNRNDIEISSTSGQLKYFYEPKPNSIQKWNPQWLGYEVTNKINSESLNDEREFAIDKPEGIYRIETLGDSFTFGQYVKTEENYSRHLENYLNDRLNCPYITKFEVLNLGVYGYDIEYQVNRFVHRGIKYAPDLVIWYLNNWNFMKINEFYLPYKESIIKSGVTEFLYDLNGKIVLSAAKIAYDDLQKKYGLNNIIDYQQKAMQLLKAYKGKILFISTNNLPMEVNSMLSEIEQLNKNVSHYSRLYDIRNDEKYHLSDNHPNIQGHQRIAEDIFSYLMNNIFSDCQ